MAIFYYYMPFNYHGVTEFLLSLLCFEKEKKKEKGNPRKICNLKKKIFFLNFKIVSIAFLLSRFIQTFYLFYCLANYVLLYASKSQKYFTVNIYKIWHLRKKMNLYKLQLIVGNLIFNNNNNTNLIFLVICYI